MQGKKTDSDYIDLFDKISDWLANNETIRGAVDFFQRHIRKILIVAALAILCIPLIVSSKSEKPRPVANHAFWNLRFKKMTTRLDKVQQQQAQEMAQIQKQLTRIEDKYAALSKELDFVKQQKQLGQVPLLQMQISGRTISLPQKEIVWLNRHVIELTQLRFYDATSDKTLAAKTIVRCQYALARGSTQTTGGEDNRLVLKLPVRDIKFTVQMKSIHFITAGGQNYTGFGYFEVQIDSRPPQLKATIDKGTLTVEMQDEKSGLEGLSLMIDGKSEKQLTPTGSSAPWQRTASGYRLALPLSSLKDWQNLDLVLRDRAGNTTTTSLGRLPRLQIAQASGKSFTLPVVLPIVRPEYVAADTQTFLHIEQFSQGGFRFYREMMAGPLSLPEGLFRAKAFLRKNGKRGPYSEPVVFRVDTTAPQGEIALEQKGDDIVWKITTTEPEVTIATTVRQKQRLLALNVPGNIGNCRMGDIGGPVQVEVTLQDQAGNRSQLVKEWQPARSQPAQPAQPVVEFNAGVASTDCRGIFVKLVAMPESVFRVTAHVDGKVQLVFTRQPDQSPTNVVKLFELPPNASLEFFAGKDDQLSPVAIPRLQFVKPQLQPMVVLDKSMAFWLLQGRLQPIQGNWGDIWSIDNRTGQPVQVETESMFLMSWRRDASQPFMRLNEKVAASITKFELRISLAELPKKLPGELRYQILIGSGTPPEKVPVLQETVR